MRPGGWVNQIEPKHRDWRRDALRVNSVALVPGRVPVSLHHNSSLASVFNTLCALTVSIGMAVVVDPM